MMEYHLTTDLMEEFALYLRRAERSPGTVEKYLRDVRAFAAFARGARSLAPSDEGAVGIRGPRKSPAERVLWGEEEQRSERAPARGPGERYGACDDETEGENQTITRETVSAWKEHLLARGYAPVTINSMLAALHCFFEFAGWQGCQVKYLKVQRRLFRDAGRELNRSDYEKLISAARERGKERLALLMEAICATGIRVSEVQYLTVKAVQQGRAEVALKGKIRTILIPGKLVRKLLKYAKKQKIASGEIFLTGCGKPLSRRQIWAEMKALCKYAGVEASKVFPHNLRHLFAVSFYRVCRDIARLADVLGHSSIETTRIYLLTTGAEHARQLERLSLVS